MGSRFPDLDGLAVLVGAMHGKRGQLSRLQPRGEVLRRDPQMREPRRLHQLLGIRRLEDEDLVADLDLELVQRLSRPPPQLQPALGVPVGVAGLAGADGISDRPLDRFRVE